MSIISCPALASTHRRYRLDVGGWIPYFSYWVNREVWPDGFAPDEPHEPHEPDEEEQA